MTNKPQNKTPVLLPPDFVPGIEHVIIGKGKKHYAHKGNLRLRQMVRSKLDEYVAAMSKSAKSAILVDMIQQVRDSSTHGGFVRQDKDTGLWCKAEDTLAREKTSQVFRDALHEYYKSSRRNRRREKPSHNKEDVFENDFSSNYFPSRKRQRIFYKTATRASCLSITKDLSTETTADPMGSNNFLTLWADNGNTIQSSSCSAIDMTKTATNKKLMATVPLSSIMPWSNGGCDSLLNLLPLPINEHDENPFEPTPIRPKQEEFSLCIFS